MPEKLFLATLEQVKELSSNRNTDRRNEIVVEILARPYKQPSALSVIANSILDAITWVFDQLYDLEKKRRSRILFLSPVSIPAVSSAHLTGRDPERRGRDIIGVRSYDLPFERR